jgi:hypothetical protein
VRKQTILFIALSVFLVACTCDARQVSLPPPSPTLLVGTPAVASVPTGTPTSPPPTDAPTVTPDISAGSVWDVELVGRVGGHPSVIVVQGPYAYVGAGRDFLIWDLSSPTHIVQAGVTQLPVEKWDISGICVKDNYAYVATRASGLRVVDVSNPIIPIEVGLYGTSGAIQSVVVVSDYVYAVEDSGAVRILDISNPPIPIEIGSYISPQWIPVGIAVAGDFAYLATGEQGLQVLDVSDPSALVEIVSYVFPGTVQDVVVKGDYAYVSSGFEDDDGRLKGSLYVVEISSQAALTVVGAYEMASWPNDLAMLGDYIYIIEQYGSLEVLDVSTPSVPTKINDVGVSLFEPRDLAVGDKYIYIVDWEGVHIIDVSILTNPVEVELYDTLAAGYAVTVSKGYAYVAEGKDGPAGLEWGRLGVVDVSQPASPRVVGSYNMGRIATDVVVVDDTIYVTDGECEFGAAACWGDMLVLDSSDPETPTLLGVYSLTGIEAEFPTDRSWFGSGVAALGNYAYVTGGTYYPPQPSGEHGLRVVDVSSPTLPTTIGVLKADADVVPWSGHGVTVVGNYAYVAAGDSGLRIVDVSRPAFPVEVGFYEMSGALDVEAIDGYAYVAATLGLYVIDVSDPTAPVQVGFCKIPGRALDVAVSGDNAYVAAHDMGLRVVDVSIPTSPVEVGFYDVGYAQGVTVESGYVYVVGSDGLFILRVVPLTAMPSFSSD